MGLDVLIKQFEEELELEPLRQETEGVYVLPFDDVTSITISEGDEGYLLSCDVCSLPEEGDREAFFGHCLLANLFFQGTAGSVLGLDEDGIKLQLLRDCSLGGYRDFTESMEDFMNAITFWRDEVADAWK